MATFYDLALYLLPTIIFVSILSLLYKENPIYGLVEGLAVGFGTGNVILVTINTLNTRVVTPMMNGDYILFIVILLGLAYFTYFSNKTRSIYRTVVVLVAAAWIGVGTAATVSLVWSMAKAMTQVIDLDSAIKVFLFIIGATYFLFAERIGKSLRGLPSIARYILLIQVGVMLPFTWLRYANNAIGWIGTTVKGTSLYIWIIAGLVVAIDAFIGWDKLLGKS